MSRAPATKLGVSNIAWPAAALGEALGLLQDLGLSAIEIAPFNVFGRWDRVLDDARRLRELIAVHGMVCTALQGIILSGCADVELFRIGHVARPPRQTFGHRGESRRRSRRDACVFGAPRQRDPGDLSEADCAPHRG